MRLSSRTKVIIGVSVVILGGVAWVVTAINRADEQPAVVPVPGAGAAGPAVSLAQQPSKSAGGTAYAATNPKEWTVVYAKIVIAYPKVKPTTEMETYAASPNLGGAPSEEAGDIRRVFPMEGLDVTLPNEELIAQLEAKDPNFEYIIAHSATQTSQGGEVTVSGTTGPRPAVQGPEFNYSYTLTLRQEAADEAGWVRGTQEATDRLTTSPEWPTVLHTLTGPSYLWAEGRTYSALGAGPFFGAGGSRAGESSAQQVVPHLGVLYAIAPVAEGGTVQ